MLEHVAQGQTRFFTPGVAPDPRGILLGRACLMTFPTLEGAVSWLRLYSAEASLDELLGGLEIAKVRTALGSHEIVVQIPAVSSYAADRAARLARLVGGAIYTGTSKHFVKYRDDRSPFGYDAVDIGAMPAHTDFMVHGDEFAQGYVKEGDLPFDRLLFRLSIRKVPGGEQLSPEDRADLFFAVAHGLSDGIIRYLWRNRVEAQAGLMRPRATSAFDDRQRDRGYMWIRARNLPERILALFIGTPGIDVFRPAGANAAVAVGFAHPIDLAACQSVFPQNTFHVFWPGDRVDVLPGPLELSDIAELTRVDIELDKPRDPRAHAGAASEPIGVELRLAAAMGPPRRVVATLIPLEHGARLKRILFALPPASLRGHRIAATERGLLVIGNENLDVIPLGQLLCELAPGLLVPLGMDIAFGYGLTVTPLQVAAAFAALGNHGIYREPRIVDSVVDRDGTVAYRGEGAVHRAVSEKTATEMMAMLKSVFDKGPPAARGTAHAIDVPGFQCAGKTGTARRYDPEAHKYSDRYLASFAGLAPAAAPRIAVVVMIDQPTGGGYYGAEVSGPVFARVASETLRYLGVPGDPLPPAPPAHSP